MPPNSHSCCGSRTLVSFNFATGLADGKTSREYMEAGRNLLLHESHFPGFQVPLPLTRSVPKTILVLFLEPILNQLKPHPQPRRVSFPDSSSYPADTSGETETEPELPELPPNTDEIARKVRSDSNYSTMSIGSTTPKEDVFLPPGRKRSKTVSMHDLTNRFFRKPVIVLSKIDIFRSAAEFQEKTKADN
jgi:hypothetical protein